MSKKPKPEKFYLYAHEQNRAGEQSRMIDYIKTLPIDELHIAKIQKGEDARSVIANNCYQLVMSQVAKQIKARAQDEEDSDPDVIAGKLKYHILLPMKKPMASEFDDEKLRDEASFEIDLCDMVFDLRYDNGEPFTEHDRYRAFDRAIRSSTLKIKPFARYLDAVITKMALQGFVIEIKQSDKNIALGEERSGT